MQQPIFVYTFCLLFIAFASPRPVEWLGETTYDFGDIQAGKPVVFSFEYRNTGSEPLVIDNVRTGCGCTTSEWEEAPVAPGATAKLVVEYDARSVGYFRKYLKVYFRGHRGAEWLWIEGFVVHQP
ncbi:MAG: DUF1573 domain-containing protein [Lewinella sp.]|nr:DUF1573 domain-containing protein [Lewinella sp.]